MLEMRCGSPLQIVVAKPPVEAPVVVEQRVAFLYVERTKKKFLRGLSYYRRRCIKPNSLVATPNSHSTKVFVGVRAVDVACVALPCGLSTHSCGASAVFGFPSTVSWFRHREKFLCDMHPNVQN